MIFRVRLPSGVTQRITLAPDENLPVLGGKIEALDVLDGQFSLYSDPRFTQPFVFESAVNGAIVFIKGTMKKTATSSTPAAGSTPTGTSAAPPSASPSEPPASSTPAITTEIQSSSGTKKDKNDAEWRPRCRHGPRGMCESCMPKEDKRQRYAAELKKWKGKGMSVAVMEALEALKFKISPQEEAHATAAAVDNSAAGEFQAYIAKTGFSQQRVGICYGDVSEEGETRVLAIYEPPQTGSEEVYRMGDEGDMTERADAIARLVGMRRVGIVFSARPRKCILSGQDVVFAARMASPLSPDERKNFVVLVVSVAETGQTLFEAYQVSDLAMEMYEADIFEEGTKQKPNSGRATCKEDVLVEGKDTRKVHTEFFLLNIPIKSCESWLNTSFAVENRDIAPQGPSDLKKAVSNDSIPYHKRLSDFHLLLFLSNMFDMNSDMPGLLMAVKEGQDIGEGYRLMIEGMASSS